MDLNLFDYLILTIIAFSGWSGFRKGFLQWNHISKYNKPSRH
jgi:hypothetical protein